MTSQVKQNIDKILTVSDVDVLNRAAREAMIATSEELGIPLTTISLMLTTHKAHLFAILEEMSDA